METYQISREANTFFSKVLMWRSNSTFKQGCTLTCHASFDVPLVENRFLWFLKFLSSKNLLYIVILGQKSSFPSQLVVIYSIEPMLVKNIWNSPLLKLKFWKTSKIPFFDFCSSYDDKVLVKNDDLWEM